jgi:hypothetical protein
MEFGVLTDVSTELDLSGGYVNVKANGVFFQLRKTDEHDSNPNGRRGEEASKQLSVRAARRGHANI